MSFCRRIENDTRRLLWLDIVASVRIESWVDCDEVDGRYRQYQDCFDCCWTLMMLVHSYSVAVLTTTVQLNCALHSSVVQFQPWPQHYHLHWHLYYLLDTTTMMKTHNYPCAATP